MVKNIPGVHHVTAIAGDPDPNLDFYTRLLGLRLVKITVNFDDLASYHHLHYGDSSGHPGTILTFFLRPGTGDRTQTAVVVRIVAIAFQLGASLYAVTPVISFAPEASRVLN